MTNTAIVADIIIGDSPRVAAMVDRWGTCFTAQRHHVPQEWRQVSFFQKIDDVAVYVGPRLEDIKIEGKLRGSQCHAKLNNKEVRLDHQYLSVDQYGLTEIIFTLTVPKIRRGDKLSFGLDIKEIKIA